MNVDAGRLLSRHGIPEWRDRGSEDAVPLLHFIKAIGVGARSTGEERFWLFLAERNELSRFPGFGAAVTGSLTVYDAMRSACRLASSEATTLRFWLKPRPDGILFCRKQFFKTPEIAPALTQLERYTLALLVQIVRLGAGPDWRPSEVWLSAEVDAGVPEWRAFADATLHFCAPYSAILVPNEILSLPLPDGSAAKCAAGDAAELRRPEAWAEPDLLSTLRLLLSSLLNHNTANIETVAAFGGISTRTLQRQLADQGTSFSAVLEQARYQAAARMLRQSDIAVADVSDAVGYEHPQHFIRAFRRWSGVTPNGYRGSLAEANGAHAATAGRP